MKSAFEQLRALASNPSRKRPSLASPEAQEILSKLYTLHTRLLRQACLDLFGGGDPDIEDGAYLSRLCYMSFLANQLFDNPSVTPSARKGIVSEETVKCLASFKALLEAKSSDDLYDD